MTNSVDHDQTAPSGAVWSGSALFVYAILSEKMVCEVLGLLPYISTDLLENIYMNCNNTKYWDNQACANSVDPDQMPEKVATLFATVLQFVGRLIGIRMDLFKFKDKNERSEGILIFGVLY